MKIYKLTTVTDHIVDAFKKLIPQLSSSSTLPNKKDLEGIVNSNNAILFIAEENNVILGTLTLVFNKIPTGDKVWIEDVVVDNAARGKGIGKELTLFAIEYVRVAANKLYQKLGFVKRVTNVYNLKVTKNTI